MALPLFVLARLAAAFTLAFSGVRTLWSCCDANKNRFKTGAIFSFVLWSVMAKPFNASSKRSMAI